MTPMLVSSGDGDISSNLAIVLLTLVVNYGPSFYLVRLTTDRESRHLNHADIGKLGRERANIERASQGKHRARAQPMKGASHEASSLGVFT